MTHTSKETQSLRDKKTIESDQKVEASARRIISKSISKTSKFNISEEKFLRKKDAKKQEPSHIAKQISDRSFLPLIPRRRRKKPLESFPPSEFETLSSNVFKVKIRKPRKK